MNELKLLGCKVTTLAGYLQALGLLRVVARQRDPSVRLRWLGEAPVLSTELTAAELTAWLCETYEPSPLVSPWNAGSGFAGNGKSATAEQTLDAFRRSAEPRFAALRRAIAATDRVVSQARARGWEGDTMWAKAHKSDVVRLGRALLPDDALPWLDVAVTMTIDDLAFSPLTGTGGNFGRQDLSSTFLQRLLQVIGPEAKPDRSTAWAEAALYGREDVPYLRDTVGQYDPGRAGGILSTPQEAGDGNGFTNPWAQILTLEGTLVFSAALTRRFGTSGGSLPFLTRASTVGYQSAATGEAVRGEQWVPLWNRPAGLAEIEQLMGEGRAQWNGRRADTGLEFALAIVSLGVDRGLTEFRRFVLVDRLGQSPLAIPAGAVAVRREPRERLLRDPYNWLRALSKLTLPGDVAAARRRTEEAIYAVAQRGGDRDAMARFVIEFGRLHALVARSGTLRGQVGPYAPPARREWPASLPDEDEARIAAAFASLHDDHGSLRELLTPVHWVREPGRRPELRWLRNTPTRLALTGPTLARALAEAHRLRGLANGLPREQDEDADLAGRQTAYTAGLSMPVELAERYCRGELSDGRIAAYLEGLLALGCAAFTTAPRSKPDGARPPLAISLCLFLPFYGAKPFPVDRTREQGKAREQGEKSPPHIMVSLAPRPDWVPRLLAGGVSRPLAQDVLRRLRIAGFPPVLGDEIPNPLDGTRIAGALLLRIPHASRGTALSSICHIPTPNGAPA